MLVLAIQIMLPSVVKDFRNVESKIELTEQDEIFSSNPPHRTAFWIAYEGSEALLIAQVGASPLSKTLLGRNK